MEKSKSNAELRESQLKVRMESLERSKVEVGRECVAGRPDMSFDFLTVRDIKQLQHISEEITAKEKEIQSIEGTIDQAVIEVRRLCCLCLNTCLTCSTVRSR